MRGSRSRGAPDLEQRMAICEDFFPRVDPPAIFWQRQPLCLSITRRVALHK